MPPGDRIFIGQASGEPIGLVAALLGPISSLGGLAAFCGCSLNPIWREAIPEGYQVGRYWGLGAIRPLVRRGGARVIPFSMSQLGATLESRHLAANVVQLQVSPAVASRVADLRTTDIAERANC